MRRPAVLALALVAAVLPAAPAAAAAPPVRSDFAVTFPAGLYCEFPLLVESTSKVKVVEREDSTVLTAANEVLTLTDLDSGASVGVRLGGTYRDSVLEGGGSLTVTTGRTLIATPTTGVTLLVGRFEATRGADGALLGGFVGSGRQVQLCDQLG